MMTWLTSSTHLRLLHIRKLLTREGWGRLLRGLGLDIGLIPQARLCLQASSWVLHSSSSSKLLLLNRNSSQRQATCNLKTRHFQTSIPVNRSSNNQVEWSTHWQTNPSLLSQWCLSKKHLTVTKTSSSNSSNLRAMLIRNLLKRGSSHKRFHKRVPFQMKTQNFHWTSPLSLIISSRRIYSQVLSSRWRVQRQMHCNRLFRCLRAQPLHFLSHFNSNSRFNSSRELQEGFRQTYSRRHRLLHHSRCSRLLSKFRCNHNNRTLPKRDL